MRAARTFDIVLLWAIVASVVVVLLESLPATRAAYGPARRCGAALGGDDRGAAP